MYSRDVRPDARAGGTMEEHTAVAWVLGASTALQFLAAFLALRLIGITKHRVAWLLVASAIVLMGVRRSISLLRLLTGDAGPPPDPAAEVVALGISVLMVAGVAFIAPLFREITGASAEVERSRRQLQAVLDQASAVVFIKDLAGRYRLANARALQLLEKDADEVLGRTDFDLFSREVAEPIVANDRRVLEERANLEFDEPTPDAQGTLRHFLSVKFPLLDDAGEPYAVCGISTDITERLRLEEERRQFESQMQHAQKLESLGLLAGGIAHDFNNLLVAILGNADLALGRSDLHPDVRRGLEEVRGAAEAAAGLCRQLLAYSGRGSLQVAPVDLSELVRRMGQLLEVSTSKKARVELHLAEDLPAVEADESQMQQVAMNLLTNASEAIGEHGGVVSITTRRVTVGREEVGEEIDAGEELAPGEYVCLEVADTGSGMDEETRRRLFEPFYTTRFTGRGLGLAAVLGIVRGHGGAITVSSAVGGGTTVRVLLPASRAGIPDRPTPREPARGPAGRGTVLVVDDEPGVRRFSEQALRGEGHEVLTAESGDEALRRYRERRDEIVLVLLDLTMPGMDGRQTFAELRKLDPEVRVVLTSGYDEAAEGDTEGLGELAGFLRKPYTARQLRETVRRALEPSAQPG